MRLLPSGLLSRVGSLGRVGKHLAIAGAQRLAHRDEPAQLGTQLFDELDRIRGTLPALEHRRADLFPPGDERLN